MPPNPDRQAKLAARRLQMENDPDLSAARESANAAVLGGSKTKDPEIEAVKPRQMLPNYYAEGGAVKPNYDKWATDPERWSKAGRMGFDPDAPNPSIKGEDYPKKGSYTVPKMCGGGKVIKTWSK